MQSKRCLLLVVFLLVLVVHSDYIDREDNVISDSYKDKSKGDDEWKLSARRNRYSPYASSLGNYRTRSRWTPSQDDLTDVNDWSHSGYNGGGSPITSPPVPFDTPSLRLNPMCYPLIDPQYPLFSDICGAVPQARYSLPNAFGHRDRWQIAQTLMTIMSQATVSSADPSCPRSLRLLLCPLLFPPCQTRYESPAGLPCQPFCRAVKLQCASPTIDLLPCDFLPFVSDICPLPLGYGPFASPPGLSPFAAQSLASFPGGFPPSLMSAAAQGAMSPFSGGLSSSFMPGSASGAMSPFSGGFSPSLMSAISGQGPMSSMNFFNSGSLGSDSTTPVLIDFPPRSMPTDYRQATRYTSPGRSLLDGF